MDTEVGRKGASVIGDIIGEVWRFEKGVWRLAALLGLMGAIVGALIGGFFGYALYGYAGMVGIGLLGAILGWAVATLVFYFLLSTTSLFG